MNLYAAMTKKKLSIKSFLLYTSVVFSSIGFFIIYFGATQAYNSAIRSNAIEVSSTLATTTFESMYKIMRQGWSREQLEDFISNLQERNDEKSYSIGVYRGALVSELYGPISQTRIDPFIQETFDNLNPQTVQDDNLLRYSYPLKAQAECLACHTNAQDGDVLGVIEVRRDLEPLLINSQNSLVKNLLLMAPLPLILALLVIYFLNRRINQSINLLEERIDSIQSVSDLTKIQFHSTELGFSDLNKVFEKVGKLTDKLRTVAVDKDLLEFEIRLLERFVITSDVVRDWHEYVSMMLIEINQVLNVYTLFSIFKVEEDHYDLDIFWLAPASEQSQQEIERVISDTLNQSPQHQGSASLQVNHHFSSTTGDPVVLDCEEIAFQTKSLLLDTPKIGGIVGVGVHSDIAKDETRILVIESILSTLLNVVGSVKAIYRYTKDLEYYATRDPLTGLYNQRLFWELMGYEINRSERHDNKVGLLIIDMDNFKYINDSHGHNFGDKYLQEFARSLKNSLRGGDILARYGGDEFVIILPEADLEQASMVGQRILDQVNKLELATTGGELVKCTMSIGMAIYPDHAQNQKDLFMFADNIMYKAKKQGKNRVCIPSSEDVIEIYLDLNEKGRLISHAIENNLIVPYFQPIMGMENDKIEAVEVLSRIHLDNGQVIGAHEFIEIAESMGLIHTLDYMVLEKALQQVKKENFLGLLFINLSPRSLILSEFIPRIKEIVKQAGIDNSRIVFEITERDTVKNFKLLQQLVVGLKNEGFHLAVDDFGSGFSSFHYLKHFPIDYVKIEGEFVANMAASKIDSAVVRCIADLAHSLGAKTVAEFVESEEVLLAVKEANITYAQGYHISRPKPFIYSDNAFSIEHSAELLSTALDPCH